MKTKTFTKKQSSPVKNSFWTPSRVVLTLVVMALLVAIGVSSCNSSDEVANSRRTVANTPSAPVRPVAPAPAGLTTLPPSVLETELRTVNGKPIKLGDYSGKVLLVNLWATWCGPCRSEIPELVKLHKEFRSRGVTLVGLSTENPDTSVASVKSFVHYFNVDYHIGWAPRNVAIALMQGHESIPQSFVIARDGRIVWHGIGFNPVRTPVELRQAIEQALSG